MQRITFGAIALVAVVAVFLLGAWPASMPPRPKDVEPRERSVEKEQPERITQESYGTASPRGSTQKISGKISQSPVHNYESLSSKEPEFVAEEEGAITGSGEWPPHERTSLASRSEGASERVGVPRSEAGFLGPGKWMAGTPPEVERAVQRELERPLPSSGPDGLVLAARTWAMEDLRKRVQACHRDVSGTSSGLPERIAFVGDLVGGGAMARLERVSIIAQTGLDDAVFQDCALREASKVLVPYRGQMDFTLAWELPLSLP